jgi:pimeloyl-ACP methyl ester carboxylesterase
VTDLHHSEQGTGDPPALLIHGTGPAVWGDLPGLLAQHRRTIVYERRGSGDSPGPTGTNSFAHADDAAALLEDLARLRKAAKRRAGRLPRVEVRTVTGAGHGLQFDRPDAVADAVQEVAA